MKPLEIALKIIEKEEHNAHEDEAHRLMGVDIGEEQEDFLICTITSNGKVLIPGRDDDGGESL
jgi:hypothetical protein